MLDGKLLVIFPEATIHQTFDPTKGKTGAARLALATNVALVPAAAWGGQQIATKGGPKRPGWFSQHRVVIGPPIAYRADDSVTALTERIMLTVAALVEQAASEVPADLGEAVVGR
jgi:1-acyl-sn-glycerol-3-phosphate acyltransferase